MMDAIKSTLWTWCDLDSDEFVSIQISRKIISAEENSRSERFRFDIHKNRYIRCRAYLRLILCELTGEAPENLTIDLGENEKPYLKGNPVYFNLSRSGRYAAYAFNYESPVGIDVEFIKPSFDFLNVTETVFSKNEIKLLRYKSRTEQQKAFYQFWTAKEAYLKLLGTGLMIEPIHVSLNFEFGIPVSCSLKHYPDSSLTYIKLPINDLICCLSTPVTT
ncbi:MAG: 4'-phosphopantetheinyl transferase [Gammaproteobacteria bacterium]|jgi:4'-phosphopantetheinyl transferase